MHLSEIVVCLVHCNTCTSTPSVLTSTHYYLCAVHVHNLYFPNTDVYFCYHVFLRANKLKFSLNMYQLRENRQMKPRTFMHMVSNTLYTRRLVLYNVGFYVHVILVDLFPSVHRVLHVIVRRDQLYSVHAPDSYASVRMRKRGIR